MAELAAALALAAEASKSVIVIAAAIAVIGNLVGSLREKEDRSAEILAHLVQMEKDITIAIQDSALIENFGEIHSHAEWWYGTNERRVKDSSFRSVLELLIMQH